MGKTARILLAIFFFPIGTIMVFAGVSTKATALTYAGVVGAAITVIVVVAVVMPDTSVTAEPGETPMPAPSVVQSTPPPTSISNASIATCPTREEVAYFAALSESLVKLGSGLTTMSTLIEVANANLTPENSKEWALEVAIPAGTVSNAVNSIKALSPPASLREIHDVARDLADHSFLAASLYIQGLDTFNADAIGQANDHIATGLQVAHELDSKRLGFQEHCQNEERGTAERPSSTPVPTATSTPRYTPRPTQDWRRPTPTPSPTVSLSPTLPPTATPTPIPTLIPTLAPTPTPEGPLMAMEECQQVVETYMAGIIEDAILMGADKPMSFRYWTEGQVDSWKPLGYRLYFKAYTGFGEKPTHHEVVGTVRVQWWDNTTTSMHVRFYPHAITCLPVHNADYEWWSKGMPQYFEHAHVAFAVDAFVGEAERVGDYLVGVDTNEPAGIVEIEQ